MFKAWLFGVAILFVLAELSMWLKQFILPLPIYILAGAFLAIASNYEKGLIALFRKDTLVSDPLTQTATLIAQAKALPGQEVANLPQAD
ncbi:hypothetical protein C7B62_03650 [Pleurocapsa sp. CCALA 161]|uniref:hypothetical protein n=1 Tax=Pleurocapsa sp. CCALA 161 TaxID=2107688 RepID=UPI000D0507CD|nr:hypothetical protein [Pleurocapsa sp. CCALA 161]PSB11990.1 hypothetical protein C7B62_03650 [Pleurocapsa sp. CCALA 161]